MPSEHDSPTAGRRRADNRRFDAGIAHLHRYVAVHGSSSPARHATIGDSRIGAWVDSRRTDYRLGRLSSERIRRIETEFPDWRWNVLDAAFAAGIAHLRRYAATQGTSNPRQHDVIDSFPIGQWAANRRSDYRRGTMPAERARRLEVEFDGWRWTADNRPRVRRGVGSDEEMR